MTTLYTNAAASAIADSTVTDELSLFSIVIDAKHLARIHKASKAYKAEVAAGFVTGRLVPGNISQRQAAALVGVSPSYVAHVLGRERGRNGKDNSDHHHPLAETVINTPTDEARVIVEAEAA